MPELIVESTVNVGDPVLDIRIGESAKREIERFAVQQNVTTLRNRVNELGVAEPVIQKQGESRIVVQLPGVQDTARAKEILGATATLEFRMVHGESASALASGRTPGTAKLYHERNGRPILLQRNVMLTGEYITDAASGIDQQSGSPAVFITLDGKGARLFSSRTGDKIGRAMGVVYIEHKSFTEFVDGVRERRKEIVEEVINVATIRDQLGKRFQITGLDSTEEARNLALLLRAGALAAPIEIVEERTVGPSLGQANIDQGFRSVVIGFVLVLVLMAVYYKRFGLVANLALTFNLILVVAMLSLLQATLTLPGIAGIVLTVGMAVDANVLIFERIREEIRNGQYSAGEHSHWICQGVLDDCRREHHHPHRSGIAVRVRYGSDQGVRDHSLAGDRDLDVHRDHDDPRRHQPDLRRQAGGRALHLTPGRVFIRNGQPISPWN